MADKKEKINRVPPDTELAQFTDKYYDAWRSEPPRPDELARREHGYIEGDIDLPAPSKKNLPALRG